MDFLKKWLFLKKNLQFSSRFYENWCCYLPHEKLLLFHEFHLDVVKIVDFFAISHLKGNSTFSQLLLNSKYLKFKKTNFGSIKKVYYDGQMTS